MFGEVWILGCVRIICLKKGGTTLKELFSIDLKDYQTKNKTLVMFGAESSGLSNSLINFATTKMTIEMKNNVESLNLSISAGIVLYKLFLL